MSFDAFATNELINATKSGDVDRMRAAIKAGGDPDAVSACEPLVCFAAGTTAFELDVLEVLLEAGANPNQPDEWGTCALSYAVNKGKWIRASVLVKAGADINFQHEKNISKTVLFNAVMLDLERGEQTHTACVLSLKPDLSVRMFVDDMFTLFTVPEHLQRLRGFEPDKAAHIDALLKLIDTYAQANPATPAADTQAARAVDSARQAFVGRLQERAKTAGQRFKIGK